ncbi:hypothetical protein Tco_1053169 [Tanacetum coccineum]
MKMKGGDWSPSIHKKLYTEPNPRGDLKAITTRSGVFYDGPPIPSTPSLQKEVEREPKVTKDKVQPTSLESTAHVQPPVVQSSHIPSEPASAPAPTEPSSAHYNNYFEELPKRNPHQPSIPYPQRMKYNKQKEKSDT